MVGTFNQFEKNANNESVVKTYEVDFYATKGIESMYIQVTDNIDSDQINEIEIMSLNRKSYCIRMMETRLVMIKEASKNIDTHKFMYAGGTKRCERPDMIFGINREL